MSSFYGGVSATAFLEDYVATFYLPVFTLQNGVLTIKNYGKKLQSKLSMDEDQETLNIETNVNE